MPQGIFISYRREDSAGDAGRLADHLHRRFGRARVFLDIDAINPGHDFRQVLLTSLRETTAVLVVIGPRWTTLQDGQGARRIDGPNDYVRLEVESALGRDIPVVPVLVQGAKMPRADDLPAALKGLATRQAASLDHAEFHDDAERLCDYLATIIGDGESGASAVRRWWPAAAAAVVVLGLIGYFVLRATGNGASSAESSVTNTTTSPSPTDDATTAPLLAEAAAQRRRNQFAEALATLGRARAAAPASAAVLHAQEDVAMEWIRNVRVASGTSTFTDAIKPALAVVDGSLPQATGQRRADLLAHTGWATFLLWRDGDRRLNPSEWYRDALAVDPSNPYANAMLAHWVLFQDDDVAGAARLFGTAVQSGRALDAVRTLQWSGYNNSNEPAAVAERVRLADAMRRGGETLTARQAQDLWAPYYFAMPASREKDQHALLTALPADDHIATLGWAFADYAKNEESRQLTVRYYVALLHASAGRTDRAVDELRTLDKELARAPGSLQDAVQAALERLRRVRPPR